MLLLLSLRAVLQCVKHAVYRTTDICCASCFFLCTATMYPHVMPAGPLRILINKCRAWLFCVSWLCQIQVKSVVMWHEATESRENPDVFASYSCGYSSNSRKQNGTYHCCIYTTGEAGHPCPLSKGATLHLCRILVCLVVTLKTLIILSLTAFWDPERGGSTVLHVTSPTGNSVRSRWIHQTSHRTNTFWLWMFWTISWDNCLIFWDNWYLR